MFDGVKHYKKNVWVNLLKVKNMVFYLVSEQQNINNKTFVLTNVL